MSFWKHQDQLKKKTRYCLIAFLGIVLLAGGLAEILWRWSNQIDLFDEEYPYVAICFTLGTICVAVLNYLHYWAVGGGTIAESMGGEFIDRDTNHPTHRIVLNIIEELAIAADMSVPRLYILPDQEINAFAAGMSPQTWIVGLTKGAIQRLSRDEIQGVLAHEFGHLKNGDLLLNMGMTAMIMGLSCLAYIGLRFISFFGRNALRMRYGSRNKRENNQTGIFVFGGVLFVAGLFGGFFGSVLRALLSRTREYLADATAVEITRSSEGLINALKKIADEQDKNNYHSPLYRFVYSHLFFSNTDLLSCLFATHPPLHKRIHLLEEEEFTINRSSSRPFRV